MELMCIYACFKSVLFNAHPTMFAFFTDEHSCLKEEYVEILLAFNRAAICCHAFIQQQNLESVMTRCKSASHRTTMARCEQDLVSPQTATTKVELK
jgi:hypothetical protein